RHVSGGQTCAASVAVTGVGSPAAALGPADSFTYYVGSSVSGSGSSTAPTNAGTYTVVAHFNTTTNYLAADSAAVTITIGKATPTVTVTWADPQTFNGNPHPASAAVTEIGRASCRLGPADSFTYYVVSSVSG